MFNWIQLFTKIKRYSQVYSFVIITLLLLSILNHPALAQENIIIKEQPAFKLLRAEENYQYLKQEGPNLYQKDIFDAIKYISLNSNGEMYISLGGQIRPRFQHFTNRFWLADIDQNFYSQRLALNSNFVLGKYFRFFGELYHGYTSHEREFAGYDQVDIFQAFGEFKLPSKQKRLVSFRFGRQEMGLGATRLIGIREGPNIRRSFDMGRFIFQQKTTIVQAFYGKEVLPLFEAFDNSFSLFDDQAINPQLWGLYTQFKIKGVLGMNELYYLGFHSDNTSLSDVTGDETRHSIGFRHFGKWGKSFNYNSEIVYQFGKHGDSNISAFDLETDWKYEFTNTSWKITPGLKLQYSSGDKTKGDGKINTFNPMFVNPSYYGLITFITPMNIISLHPSVSFRPVKKMKLYFDWAIFRRASNNDALYRPTRFIYRPSNGSREKDIGNQFGFELQYRFDRHVTVFVNIDYFTGGEFLEDTGEAENTLHIAPTLSYIF